MAGKRIGPLFCVTLLFLSFTAFPLLAADTPVPDRNDKLKQYAEFSQTVLSTLAVEEANLPKLQSELDQIKERKGGFETEIGTYRVQLSTYGNLLSIPNTAIKDLETAGLNNRATLDHVNNRIQAMSQLLDQTIRALDINMDQLKLNETQLTAIKSEARGTTHTGEIISNLQSLISTLSKKQKLLDIQKSTYTQRKTELEEIQNALGALSQKFEGQIKALKKEKLWQRQRLPITVAQWRESSDELIQLKHQIKFMTTSVFWFGLLEPMGSIGLGSLLSAVILFATLMLFLVKGKRFCTRIKEKTESNITPWRATGLAMVANCLPLLGVTLYFYFFTLFFHFENLPIVNAVGTILWVFIFTRWVLDFFIVTNKEKSIAATNEFIASVWAFVWMIRIFSIFYSVGVEFFTGIDITMFFMRLMFELALMAWFVAFRIKHAHVNKRLKFLLPLGYVVFGSGLIIELSGYRGVALHWYISWGKSIITAIWAVISFMTLKEWHQTLYSDPQQPPEGHTETKWPIQWVTYQCVRFIWVITLSLAVFFSWGASQTVINTLISALKYPISIGQMNFSLMGSFYAFLVLFITHILAKLFRYGLKDKLLSKSGIAQGLQASITSIFSYLLWGFGFLFALHAFGLNTTSLAVALGALGIGLGFGLQNIFNNFISGIILLFERPIQVGDEVEINGIWCTVQKINVRSTVVQTVDNAAIIIPNSEFISRQVVNWSFKDKWIRRRIKVGVSYGSDIERVRDTLIEIARKTPHVVKNKKIEVMFTDFGDSALIFVLRYYTITDHIWTTETAIRFEIDRLFKERNITIAFPQQDVHLHHVTRPAEPEV